MIENMKRDSIVAISKALNISPLDILGMEDIKSESDITTIYNQLVSERQEKVYNFAEYQLTEQNKVVNLNDYISETLVGYVSAGTGEYLSDNINEEVKIPTSELPKQQYDLVLRVNGDSMEPIFQDKEYVFVKTSTELRSGQIGVFIIDGESYLKKAYVESNHIRLVSLNRKYEDLIFNEIADVKLIGTVIL